MKASSPFVGRDESRQVLRNAIPHHIISRRVEKPDGIRQRGQSKRISPEPEREPKRIIPQAKAPRPSDGIA